MDFHTGGKCLLTAPNPNTTRAIDCEAYKLILLGKYRIDPVKTLSTVENIKNDIAEFDRKKHKTKMSLEYQHSTLTNFLLT